MPASDGFPRGIPSGARLGFTEEQKNAARYAYASRVFPSLEVLAERMQIPLAAVKSWKRDDKGTANDWDDLSADLQFPSPPTVRWSADDDVAMNSYANTAAERIMRIVMDGVDYEPLFFRAARDIAKGETVPCDFLYTEGGKRQAVGGLRPKDFGQAMTALKIAFEIQRETAGNLSSSMTVEEEINRRIVEAVRIIAESLGMDQEAAARVIAMVIAPADDVEPMALPEHEPAVIEVSDQHGDMAVDDGVADDTDGADDDGRQNPGLWFDDDGMGAPEG